MKNFKIENFEFNQNSPAYIIAEAGVNHNGSITLARELVDAAKEAGANCVKFQTFRAENLVTKTSPKAAYQLKVTPTTESQFDMLKSLELTEAHYVDLIEYCKKREITFLSTPYNIEDIDFLHKLKVPAFKIASGQIVEDPFLDYISKVNIPIIASTGMAYLADIDKAVRIFRNNGLEDFVILQCTTNYPSKSEDSNLRAMVTMGEAFKCFVGYSDHTLNNLSMLGSIALGAKVIEKHFTLDKNMKGPDHSCSADPKDFLQLVKEIRELESALGHGLKIPTKDEVINAKGMRRSLVTNKALKAGDIITKDAIGFKRPEGGIETSYYNKVVGKRIKIDIDTDTTLKEGMIEW